MMWRTVAAGLLAGAMAAAPARGQDWLWLNLPDYPASLEETPWAWSAIRSETGEVSHRVAADDFVVGGLCPPTITAVEFWAVALGEADVLGVDWYVFDAPTEEGPPGALLAHGAGVPTPHEETEFVNQHFGTVYRERAEIDDLKLEPGHYFLAIRVVQALPDGGKGLGLLTTEWAEGSSRGWWNFDLLADGTVAGPWRKMEEFAPAPQEWAFLILGYDDGEEHYADCDCNGLLNLFDFFCFIGKFDAQDDYADCNADGLFNFFDFLCYVMAFQE